MKILVTGSGGYIGSIVTNELLRQDYEVVGLDNFSAGYQKPLKILQKRYGRKKFRYYTADLCKNVNHVFRKEKEIDLVIHLAGVCSVDESMRNPAKYMQNNVVASMNLLDKMREEGIKKIIFSSTCNVYEDINGVIFSEENKLGPINPYGESKLMVEKMIQWYHDLFDIQYIIFRYFNVCGATEDGLLGDSKNPSILLVHNAIMGALGMQTFHLTCKKFDTPDGSPIRDYIDVLDLAKAHTLAIHYMDKNDTSEIVNLGTGTGSSVLEIIHTIQEITKKSININYGETRKGEYIVRKASIAKAWKLLGWKPKRNITQSIQSAVLWYKENPNRWLFA